MPAQSRIYEFAIIGSGASASAAALQLTDNGIFPLMLDIGHEHKENLPIPKANFYEFSEKESNLSITIGENLEILKYLTPKAQKIPSKLQSPFFDFVTNTGNTKLPLFQDTFFIRSFAKGGLGNAWGAGLYEFNDDDLKDFPILIGDLSPYYEKLARHIGICGENDDLTIFFNSSKYLLPSLPLSCNMQHIHNQYIKNKNLLNKQGLFLGRPRLGVLSKDLNKRKKHINRNLEFWDPNIDSIYTPRQTIEELIKKQKIEYISNLQVKRWKKFDSYYIIESIDLKNNIEKTFNCKKLLIGAGCIETTRIVLNSKQELLGKKLSLLDNNCIQLPLFFLRSLGKSLDINAFGLTQLNMIYSCHCCNERFQGSLLEVTSPRRAEFFKSLPLDAVSSLSFMKYILPSMAVFQLFFPDTQKSSSELFLENDTLRITHHKKNDEHLKFILKVFQSFFLKLKVVTHWKLALIQPRGLGIHYAGTLPMKKNPSFGFECHPNGRLHGEEEVFIIDGAGFPSLPSKNYSFTLMANAMRIATESLK